MVILAAASTVFVIVSSAPPQKPEEAVKILRASKSISDRTDARTYPDPDVRVPANATPSSKTGGPFGEFKGTPLPVSYRGPYVHPGTPEVIVRMPESMRSKGR